MQQENSDTKLQGDFLLGELCAQTEPMVPAPSVSQCQVPDAPTPPMRTSRPYAPAHPIALAGRSPSRTAVSTQPRIGLCPDPRGMFFDRRLNRQDAKAAKAAKNVWSERSGAEFCSNKSLGALGG